MLKRNLPSWGTILSLIIFWQVATYSFDIPRWLLPSPYSVILAFWKWKRILMVHIGVTTYETIVGFTVAVIIGVPLAALLVSSEFIERALYPILTAVQSIPKTAIAPLLLVWLGAGEMPKIIIAFLISFFPIVVDTATGMMVVERDLLDLVKSMCATKRQTFWQIRLPSALPYTFSACKVAITLAVVGAVIGEFVGSDKGLGYIILVAASQLQTDVAFVAIILLALIGIILFSAISMLERVLLPWYIPEKETITQV